METKTSDSYKKEILEKYQKEKGGEMSGYLAEPTTKQIRKACLWLLDKRDSRNDKYILNHFFDFDNEENRFNKIKKIDEAKFKPIVYFLKKKTHNPSIENLELISWLVDFKPRPYQEYLKSENKTSIKKIESDYEQEDVDNINKGGIKEPEEKKIEIQEEKKKRRRFIIISISIVFGAILITSSTARSLLFNNNSQKSITEPKQCMTWTKTHYEEVSCTQKFSSRTEPIDPIKLTNFKKVNVNMATDFFDEETKKPRIWYYKNKKGEIEYYTAPGLHPVNGETLKKITTGIINKYVPMHTNNINSFLPKK